MSRGSNRGSRGSSNQQSLARGGRGRGGRGDGGRGSYRGRGRGGAYVDMNSMGFDYNPASESEPRTFASSASSSPLQPSSRPSTPLLPSNINNLNTPSSFSAFRGRGSFRGGGRGRGGKFTPPPPMPFFINPDAERHFRGRPAEDENVMGTPVRGEASGGSGSATPHYGIGVASRGSPAGSGRGGGGRGGSSFGGRGGRGGRGGPSFGGAGNVLLKPVKFVKAGVLFQEGEVEVLVKDQDFTQSDELSQPKSHLEHFSLADVAVPQMVDPLQSFELDVSSHPQPTTSTDPTVPFAQVHLAPSASSHNQPSPTPTPVDEVESALESMVFDDEEDEIEVEAEVGADQAEMQVELEEVVEEVQQVQVAQEPSLVVEQAEETVEMAVTEEVQQSLSVPSPSSPPTETLGFYVDTGSAADPSPPTFNPSEPPLFFMDSNPTPDSISTPRPSGPIRYSHGQVLGDQIEVDADDVDEEQIVFVPNSNTTIKKPSPKRPRSPPSRQPLASSSNTPLDDFAFNLSSVKVPSFSPRQSKNKTRPGKKAHKGGRRSGGGRRSFAAEEEAVPREGDSDVEWGSDGPPVKRQNGSGWTKKEGGRRGQTKADIEAEILADYILNTQGSDGEQDEAGMEGFLAAHGDLEQTEVGDIELERRKKEEDEADSDDGSSRDGHPGLGYQHGGVGEEGVDLGWATDDQDPEGQAGFDAAEEELLGESDSDDDSDEDDSEIDSDQAFLDALMSDSDEDDSSEDDSSDSEDEDLAAAITRMTKKNGSPFVPAPKGASYGGKKNKGKKGKGKGKQRMVESSELDSDDEEMFMGNEGSWAVEDERYIQNLLDHNNDIINGKDRKARKKLFRAIAEGDFDEYEADFSVAKPVTKKAKAAGIPSSLQSQWQTDREKKKAYKVERQQARLEALLDPYSSGSKKSRNKNAGGRKGRKAFRNAMEDDGDDGSDGGWGKSGRGKRGGKGVTDMVALDREIQVFLTDLGKTTMSLPPMEKESRKRVHQLAECYSIKSQSKGAGRQRFTVLIKTSRSSLTHANPGKIAYILKSKQSEFYGASWAKGSGSGNYTMPGTRPKGSGGGDGGFGGGKDATKRREGEAVGEGAAHLGEENLGHKLLSKMGWSQGDRIGKGDGGLNQPIMAIVKNTKFGLGAR